MLPAAPTFGTFYLFFFFFFFFFFFYNLPSSAKALPSFIFRPEVMFVVDSESDLRCNLMNLVSVLI